MHRRHVGNRKRNDVSSEIGGQEGRADRLKINLLMQGKQVEGVHT